MNKYLITIISFFFLLTFNSYSKEIPEIINSILFAEKSKQTLSTTEIEFILQFYHTASDSKYGILVKDISENNVNEIKKILAKSTYKVSLKDTIFYKLDMLGINPYLIIFITAMIPIIELRGAIPVGILFFNLNPLLVIVVSIIGNIVPVFFILTALQYLEKLFRKVKFFNYIIDTVFSITMAKSESIKQYEELGLMFFVGVPLPVTGAWTGSLISYLLKLKLKESLIYISLGVILSALIVSFFTFLGWKGLIGGVILLTVGTLLKALIDKRKQH